MLRWIIQSSLKLRYLVVFAAIIITIYGINIINKMSVDVFPEFSPPLVEIQTEGLGMSPMEVEELVTIPMEHILRGTQGVDIIRSKSVAGLSSIQLIFKEGTDPLLARQVVSERLELTKHDLPAFANPVMLQPLSATSRVMKIGITSPKYDLLDLSMTAYWNIRFRLMTVPGVANVAIWGERLKALQIQVDPNKLVAHNIPLNDVMEVASDALDFGLLPYSNSAKVRVDGFLETPNQRINIKHTLPVFGPKDLANVHLHKKNGNIIKIGDVADVKWETPLLIGDAVINDGPGLMLIVEKFPWANTLEVTKGVEDALKKLMPGLGEIEIDSQIFRPATFIELSIANLKRALLLGCLLVMVVLFLFLNDWRVSLISATAIPLSLITAGIFLYLQGTTINTMVLAGFVIALGAVVDDAIVDIENIMRRLRSNFREGSPKTISEVILDASLEVRKAIIFSTLIEVLALLPVFFLGGLSGAFFRPLAYSYAIAVIASTVVALTLTPALARMILGQKDMEKQEASFVRWLQHHYESILSRIIFKPSRSYIIGGLIVLLGIIVLPRMGHELLPSFKERDFLMHWVLTPGASHDEMYRVTQQASKELRQIPGVRNFGAHIGRALVADEVVGIDFTENWISLDPNAPYDKTVAAIQETVDGYPGLYRDVQTYLKERIREVLSGSSDAVVVRLYGPDLYTLRESAKDIKNALADINGLADLKIELQQDVPHIQIKVDLEKARSYGLKPGDIRRTASVISSGQEVSDIHRDAKVYDVMLWSIPEARTSLDSFKKLILDTPSGEIIHLEDVAEVKIAPTPNVIKREGASRRIDISANVRDRDLGSVVADVEEHLQKVKLPLGYFTKLLGEYTERRAAQNHIIALSILSIIGCYFLLQISFGNWTLAFISFLTLPAALVGGLIAAYISSGIISLGTLVGFLTVLGIVARNGILLVNHYQHLERYEGVPFGPELVLRGARERLSPILMTAIATGLALVPLVVAGNIPGQEIELPTAIVILGGLVTSTLLNLFVIPPLYLKYAKGEKAHSI